MLLIWRNDPGVRRFMHTQHLISMSEHRTWFERNSTDERRSLFVVEEHESPIGFVQFNRIGVDSAEWGFYANPEAPKGAGRKLAQVALDHAFDQLGLREVVGEVLAHNTRSLTFHRRLGFDEQTAIGMSLDRAEQALHRFSLSADNWRKISMDNG